MKAIPADSLPIYSVRMDGNFERHSLLDNVEHHIAVLAQRYRRQKERTVLSILVNAQIRIKQDWTYDNWNGGVSGHAIFLDLPHSLYLDVELSKDFLQEKIMSDLKGMSNYQSGFVAAVFIEPQKVRDADWRQQSGELLTAERRVPEDLAKRIWGEGYRVFLSHKTEVKFQAALLKDSLTAFGISAFVAHEDILPTKEWQNEIECALSSMHAFVALLTKDFHESPWTDQEVGFALGRGVPIIAVKLERDPYGFIGKFQALKADWVSALIDIAKLLATQSMMVDSYISALHACGSFDQGISLSKIFPAISVLTSQQGHKLLTAFNSNYELSGSWGFNGGKPKLYGDGLQGLLKRTLGWQTEFDGAGKLVFPRA